MMRGTKTALLTGATVLTLVAIGGGVALATDSSTPQPQAKPHRHAGLLARAEHGEMTLSGPQHRVVDVQRGQVQSASPTSITVKSADGFTATYTVNSTTKVRKAAKAAAIGDVTTGDRVVVIATKNGSTTTATRITDHPAK
jgi:hypothetical protein